MLTGSRTHPTKENSPIPAGPRERGEYAGTALRNQSKVFRSAGLTLVFSAVAMGSVFLFGCELVPRKPEAVFVLYRDRMKAGKLQEARALLSDDSRHLAVSASNRSFQSPRKTWHSSTSSIRLARPL